MSNLLLDWINNDIQLSQHVSSLESDMRNGFLIGEVLYRHNQLHSFDRFSSKNNADAQINNFCLAEPVLRAMGIRFDAQTAHSLMQGQRGAASNILYKIKMVLDHLKAIAQRSGVQPQGDASVLPLPNMPMRLSKPEYDKASQLMFESALRQLVDNPTEVLIKDHLRPFYEAGERFESDLEQGKLRSLQQTMELDSALRHKRLYDQQQNRAFMQAFDQRGLEVWMANQDKAKARETVKQNVLTKQAMVRSKKAVRARDANHKQVVDGIFDFEARLGLMNSMNKATVDLGAASIGGSGTSTTQNGQNDVEGMTPRTEMTKQVAQMRNNKSDAERLSLERERRRRRFITEREEAQVAEYHLRAASHLQEQLSRTCISEKSMLTTLSLVGQHRATMADNRAFRATQYKLRAAVDLEESLKRDNSFLDQARHVYVSEIDAQVTRYGKVLEARSCAQRTRNVETCVEILHRAIDLALEVVAFRRYAQPPPPLASDNKKGTCALLPELAWSDMRRVFVGKRDALLALNGNGNFNKNNDLRKEDTLSIEGSVSNPWGRTTALKITEIWPSTKNNKNKNNKNNNGNNLNDASKNNDNENKKNNNGENQKSLNKKKDVNGEETGNEIINSARSGGNTPKKITRKKTEDERKMKESDMESKASESPKVKRDILTLNNDTSNEIDENGNEILNIDKDKSENVDDNDNNEMDEENKKTDNDDEDVEVHVEDVEDDEEEDDLALVIANDLDENDLTHYLNNEFPFNDESIVNTCKKVKEYSSLLMNKNNDDDDVHENKEKEEGGKSTHKNHENKDKDQHSAIKAMHASLESVVDKVDPFYALGEVIVTTRLAAKPLTPPLPPPLLPQFDLRICFCGRSFSGKSEQAYLIAERFKLKVINAESMLTEAVDLGKELTKGKMDVSQLEPFTSELLAIGYKALGMLHSGQALSDELYAQLVLIAIRRVENENMEILNQNQSQNQNQNNQETPYQGWVCDDFPETSNQAKCLETLLSGYDESAHIATKWDKSSILADPIEQPLPDFPNRLLGKSGIDIVIYMEADRDVVLKRSLGRRIDPEHEKAYHLDTNRPPYDLVCKERLVCPIDPSCPSEQLALQVAAHDLQSNALQEFYKPFGNLHVVDCNVLSTQGSFAATLNVITQFVDTRLVAEEAENAEAENAVAAEEAKEREEEAQLEGIEAAAQAADNGANNGGSGDNGVINHGDKNKDDKPSDVNVNEDGEDGDNMMNVLGDCDEELAKMLVGLWDLMEGDITSNMKQVFRALREERRSVVTHLHHIRVNFADYLRRPDLNNNITSSFLTSFNSIPHILRSDINTKTELKLRCNELRITLWNKIETREISNNTRLNLIKNDGWLSHRVICLERSFASLMQIELDRFYSAIHVLMDFTTAHRRIELDDLDVVKPVIPSKDKNVPPPVPIPLRPSIVPDITATAFAKRPKTPGKAETKAPAKEKKGGRNGNDATQELPRSNDVLVQVSRAALAEITPWTREQFVVPPEDIENPLSLPGLYYSIWVQADLAIARIDRLVNKGSEIRTQLESEVSHVWQELEQWISERISGELIAVEKLVNICNDAVEKSIPIQDDYEIYGDMVEINPNYRLIPPNPPPPEPKVIPIYHQKLNQVQIVGLRKALTTASATEGFIEGDGGRSLISTDSLQDVLLRMSASDYELPEFWSLEPSSSDFEEVIDLLDPDGAGFVSITSVLNFFVDQK